MKFKAIIFSVALLGISCFASAGYNRAPKKQAKIYLPRNAKINTAQIKIDDVGIITGSDELSQKLGNVMLGRAPFPGQKMKISRDVIVSQIAAAGVNTSSVLLTGASEIVVVREASEFSAKDIIAKAREFIDNTQEDESILWDVVNKPGAIVISRHLRTTDLKCQYAKQSPKGQRNVIVSAYVDGIKVASRTVWFRATYTVRQVVATKFIKQGEEINSSNAKIVEKKSTRKIQNVTNPFGRKAYRGIQAGAVITTAMLASKKPLIVVKFNQTVQIKITGPGWKIATLGKALGRGSVGDIIRVRNIDSKKIIVCRIDKSGDVVPVAPGK